MYPSTKYEGSSFFLWDSIQIPSYAGTCDHLLWTAEPGWALGHWGLWHESSTHEDWWKPTEGNSLGEILTSDWYKYMEKEAELEWGLVDCST